MKDKDTSVSLLHLSLSSSSSFSLWWLLVWRTDGMDMALHILHLISQRHKYRWKTSTNTNTNTNTDADWMDMALISQEHKYKTTCQASVAVKRYKPTECKIILSSHTCKSRCYRARYSMKNLAKNHSPAILGPLDDWNSLQDWKSLDALKESVISSLDCWKNWTLKHFKYYIQTQIWKSCEKRN